MKESELVTKWLWEKHREDLQWRRVRLGVVPTKEMARMYSVILRWADAVFEHNGIIYIVEGKLRPQPGAIGQLELYRMIFGQTLEFKQFWNYPVKLVLLCPVLDLNMAELCTKKDIIYEVWSPEEAVS
jgi:hypothetical protein